ncbi:hypothetical protein Ri1_14750 [Aeromonas dhakensis]|nr:hypothetical protein Ri1_14750 [Aeromonas dhakensis]
MVTADDYASLIDPTRPYSTRFDLTHCLKRRIRMGAWAKPRRLTGHPSRVKPSYLAAGVGDRLGSAKDAAAPDCRRHLAPLTIHEYAGPNGGRWSSYGTRLSGAIQIHEISDATIRIKWFFSFAAEWQPAVDPWPGCDGR